jgi:putative sterol carrier protein
MPELTIQDLMDRMQASFIPERAAGIDTVVWFILSGEAGGDWTVMIQNQECHINKGLNMTPKLTLSAAAQTILDIFMNKQDPMRAYMLGKLKVKGDISMAMKLAGLFKLS